jgi:hypothetical protein
MARWKRESVRRRYKLGQLNEIIVKTKPLNGSNPQKAEQIGTYNLAIYV